ncbi:hypothetical protein HZS_2409 [Henneguya salminicola]|nr:hypothetical protein HZS_2409 [Henneguya salminicola]
MIFRSHIQALTGSKNELQSYFDTPAEVVDKSETPKFLGNILRTLEFIFDMAKKKKTFIFKDYSYQFNLKYKETIYNMIRENRGSMFIYKIHQATIHPMSNGNPFSEVIDVVIYTANTTNL